MNPSPTPAPARGRRLRDRLIAREGTDNRRLADARMLANHLMLFDDDLRETALALGSIEQFLARAISTLDCESVTRDELRALACDAAVERDVSQLDETLASLRRRLHSIAESLR